MIAKMKFLVAFTLLAGLASAALAAPLRPDVVGKIASQPPSAHSIDLRAYLVATTSTADAATITRQLNNSRQTQSLLQYTLLRRCDAKFDAWAKNIDALRFLKEFLADNEWMELVLTAGPLPNAPRGKPATTYGDVIQQLATIAARRGSASESRLGKTLATALAMHYPTLDIERVLGRYDYFWKSDQLGKLHPVFKTHTPWTMRYVVSIFGSADGSWEYLRDTFNVPISEYGRMCWVARYRLHNAFGDSIHGSRFYAPWSSKLPKWENVHKNGGVCGSLSTIGATITMAHGIPASTMGEPGHCAWTWRPRDGHWQPSYSLSSHSSLKTATWSSHYVYLQLAENTLGNREHTSIRKLGWTAEALADAAQFKAAAKLYQSALEKSPEAYDLWLAYVDLLNKPDAALTPTQAAAVATQIITRLAAWPEPAQNLLNRMTAFAKLPVETRRATFVQMHRNLLAAKFHSKTVLKRVLPAQGKSLGAIDAQVHLFRELLTLHATSEQQKFYGQILEFPAAHRRNRDATKKLAQAMLDVATKNPTCKHSSAIVAKAIQTAIELGDVGLFQTACALAEKSFLPKPGSALDKYCYLNAKQRKAYPKLPAAPGTLLSDKALLLVSHPERYNRPLLSRRAMTAGGGFVMTQKRAGATITIRLAQAETLGKLVLVGRYESAGETKAMLPFTVLTSAKGKKWIPAATLSDAGPIWTIDLKNTKAQFVRIQLADPKKAERLVFRNLLLYGAK